MTHDVVIVGGGLVGCLSAWALAKTGASVALIERTAIGAGASSAAAGILGAQVEPHADSPAARLGLASRALYPALVDELRELTGLPVPLTWPGTMRAWATDDEQAASTEALRAYESLAWQRDAGHRVELLDWRALTEREPALRHSCRAAIAFPDDGLTDPVVLLAAVERALVAAGVRTHVGHAVVRVDAEAGRARGVTLDDGTSLSADHVVSCAGAWTSLLEGIPETVRRIRPIRGQMIELELSPPPTRSIVFGAGGYVVPRDDGRIVLGSTLEDIGFHDRTTAEGLHGVLSRALDLVPELKLASWRRAWAGLRPASADYVPVIGPTPIERLWVASGHFRGGILLAPITAAAVAALVRGTDPPFPLAAFSPCGP